MSSGKLQTLRPRLPRFCVALAGEHMLQRASALQQEFRFLEFRLDSVERPEETLFGMGRLLRAHPELIAIATCRRSANGGTFAGTSRDEIHLLEQASAAGAHIVDVSLETAEDTSIDTAALDSLRRSRAALMLSWHSFSGTPDLHEVDRRMQRFAPDLRKIVPTAATLTDALRVLQLLETNSPGESTLVAMAMGTAGTLTRVLGPRSGSAFTFAADPEGIATAPGQLDARALRDLYRLDRITRSTRIYGVFGKPIGGSRSPQMLNAAFATTHSDAVHLPLEADNADELLAAMEALTITGASVTMPLKEKILSRISRVDALAASIGAANTLKREADGVLSATNTDAEGITGPLTGRIDFSTARALILGAGGAARAAVHALRSRGVDVSIVNRTHETAAALAQQSGAAVLTCEQASRMHFDVAVHATSFGMRDPDADLSKAPMHPDSIDCGLFFDLVYHPLETAMVRAMRARGVPVILGVEMFIQQGAAQFRHWTGVAAPVEQMRSAVMRSLRETTC